MFVDGYFGLSLFSKRFKKGALFLLFIQFSRTFDAEKMHCVITITSGGGSEMRWEDI